MKKEKSYTRERATRGEQRQGQTWQPKRTTRNAYTCPSKETVASLEKAKDNGKLVET
jgi:hypothetical protein